MSIAGIMATLAREAGVTAEDILNEAGLSREDAIKALAAQLGVDAATPEQAVEIEDDDVRKVREGLAVLNRAFG
jgi:2-iminoacetate synthase ThiH